MAETRRRRPMAHGPGAPAEKPKNFKGTIKNLLKYLGNYKFAILAVMIFAIGLCMTSLTIPLIAAPLFGYEACLSINGVFLGLASLASLLSSPISSMCYDTYGNYIPVFKITSVFLLGIMGVYLIMFSMARKEQERWREKNNQNFIAG